MTGVQTCALPIFRNLIEKIKDIDDYLSSPILNKIEDINELENKIHELNNNINYLDEILLFKEIFDSLNKELKEFVKEYFYKNKI